MKAGEIWKACDARVKHFENYTSEDYRKSNLRKVRIVSIRRDNSIKDSQVSFVHVPSGDYDAVTTWPRVNFLAEFEKDYEAQDESW